MAFTEPFAQSVLRIALRHNQAAELLNNLINGGGFTLDMNSSIPQLIMLPEAAIKEILEASSNDE